jgi:acyl carrier protein
MATLLPGGSLCAVLSPNIYVTGHARSTNNMLGVELSGRDGYELCDGILCCIQCLYMIASSRTPEGTLNRCPVCKKAIEIEPSMPFGDAPCPHCGCLLWFIAAESDVRFYPYEQSAALRERVIRFFANLLGVEEDVVRRNPNIWNELGADSLDMVELVMELEDEVDKD